MQETRQCDEAGKNLPHPYTETEHNFCHHKRTASVKRGPNDIGGAGSFLMHNEGVQ
jgi:hypothetical protein